MNKVLSNSLFKKDNKSFFALKDRVKEFNVAVNGNNIIQDDIFSIMENYARKQDIELETMFIPVKDDDFCAFTCIRQGKIFVIINSRIILSKQIFAAAHELYHIYCCMDETNGSLLSEGSLLTADALDENVTSKEDIEANAFAGLLLAPGNAIHEQMDIYGIDKDNILIKDIIKLMDIFAVPYKAMVLRLYEETYLKERMAEELLSVPSEKIIRDIELFHVAKRWQRRTPEHINFGRLQGLISSNIEHDVLPKSRLQEDYARVQHIIKELGKQ